MTRGGRYTLVILALIAVLNTAEPVTVYVASVELLLGHEPMQSFC